MPNNKNPSISTKECKNFRGLVAKIAAIAQELSCKPAYVVKKVLWEFVNNWKKGDKL